MSGQKESNRWLKIIVQTDPLLQESICDYLEGVLDAGVETGAPDEPLYGTIHGYIEKANPTPEEITAILSQVTSYLGELAEIFQVPVPQLSWELFAEEDWGKNWKVHFKPFAIVQDLVIAPTWEEYLPKGGEKVIVMDPGMAFGTGHHATTSLSMGFIRTTLAEQPGLRLLDVGTGTGILGMAAVLFGAEDVLGIDNDPDAVHAAADNVRRNGLEDHMQVSLAPLSSLQEPFAIVVANIVHDVLVAMADDLARLTAPGGTLVLSGVLAGQQAANIIDVFTGRGFHLSGRKSCQEWESFCFKK